MDKKDKKISRPEPPAAVNTHFDNLLALRDSNPQAYERLGEHTRQSVERYELEQVASTFEHREGMERMLELKKRLPDVYANFSGEMKRKIEEYAEKKRAHLIVTEGTE